MRLPRQPRAGVVLKVYSLVLPHLVLDLPCGAVAEALTATMATRWSSVSPWFVRCFDMKLPWLPRLP